MISNHSFKKIHPFSSAYQIKKYGGANIYIYKNTKYNGFSKPLGNSLVDD